jgi:lipopolysaccharide heptosyltransferase I
MDKFLIIRISSLGDIIHTLPAFAALRRAFPGARIAWVVEAAGKPILDLIPGIDAVVIRGEKGWIRKIRDKDLTALDFQGLIKSALIARLSGARKRIGFSGKNLREPAASLFYTDRLEAFPEDGHVIAKNLKLLSKLGLDAGTEEYEFPIVIPASLEQAVENAVVELGRRPGQRIVLCNVGAAWENKRWAPERWIELLKRIRSEALFHLLLWGNAAEKEAALRIGAATGTPVAPFFTVPEVLALIKGSRLVISGDTFALQAACALDVPVVGIFGPTNPVRNGPFRARDRTALFPLDCHPCYKRTCPSTKCMSTIKAGVVAGLVQEILKENV